VKYGGLKFLEAAHVKDVLALLKWADNPKNRIAGFRVLQLLPGVGPGHANRCLNVFEAGGYSWDMLATYRMPAAAQEEWASTAALLQSLAITEQWAGQVTAVKQWYAPHLARIYDSASVRSGDIDQLEQIAGSYASREHFISELTLDPPQATGDLAGPPLLDEDYLILSTIHSAKGQEWDSVFLLNFADGNFPSEFAGGKPELLEEERRLLYVAMTRAKQALHLIAPLKYYITQQSRMGDRHVYGARSRFVSDKVFSTLHSIGWPAVTESTSIVSSANGQRIDIAAAMRQRWL
jgi:DNA helicase-2/ATP-dependent DNA helicase PcrA